MAQTSGKIRTRFAPSPTGFVHIGNFRTGLFSHLYAKHMNGVSVLRIEDTDQNRKVEGALENLLKVMRTMGVEFDEGPYVDINGSIQEKGEYGPYLQSERLQKYQKHAYELIEAGKAYFCFCTEDRLAEMRKEQVALKKPPMYDRLCRTLTVEVIETKKSEFKQQGKSPVVRFAMPLEGSTTIHDLVYGDITYEHKVLDDQVILKSDGFPTYHLAVVVDDHYMEITHVIRGDDWIPSTPKHILIYQALGWEPTLFAHLPLIVNPDKTKLSKRQGDVSVEDFLKHGYLPEALLNFVAFLGWNPKSEQEFFSFQELVEQFDLAKVNRSGAVFDDSKLDWINSHYIRQKSAKELVQLLIPYWQEANLLTATDGNITLQQLTTVTNTIEYLEAIAGLEQERLKKLSEIAERTAYFFTEPTFNFELLSWKKSTLADAKEKLNAIAALLEKQELTTLSNKENLEALLLAFIKENSYDTGSVLWPLRVALTGQAASPGPFEVGSTLALGLGKEALIQRIKKACTLIP